MTTNEFQIEFTWQELPYLGIVKPVNKGKETWYTINLESENQESFMELTMKPSQSSLNDWDFYCDGEDAKDHYDPDLLLEVAEAIERSLADTKNAFRSNLENE